MRWHDVLPAFRDPERAPAPGGDRTRQVDAVVVAVVPEYHQAKVRDTEGHLYAITRKTQGIDPTSLREGQRVVCTVTQEVPRVLSATAVA